MIYTYCDYVEPKKPVVQIVYPFNPRVFKNSREQDEMIELSRDALKVLRARYKGQPRETFPEDLEAFVWELCEVAKSLRATKDYHPGNTLPKDTTLRSWMYATRGLTV